MRDSTSSGWGSEARERQQRRPHERTDGRQQQVVKADKDSPAPDCCCCCISCRLTDRMRGEVSAILTDHVFSVPGMTSETRIV